MRFAESARIGTEGLLSHRIRSVLTALGIIFGVAAVVAMLSIGEGAKLEALEQIRLMGVNNIIIRAKAPSATTQAKSKAKANFSTGLVALDASAIVEICPDVDVAVPQWEKVTQAQVDGEREEVRVIGTTPDFLTAFAYEVSAGRFIAKEHLAAQENVCVIGRDVKSALFRFASPIGRSIKIDKQWFTVIGVMAGQLTPSKKVENLDVRNLNMDVYIPLTTAQSKMERYQEKGSASVTFFGGGVFASSDDRTPVARNLLDQITVKLAREGLVDESAALIRRILDRRHYGVPDYEIVVPEALVRQSQKTQQIFNIVMGAIAGISLLVGGIGIMNIMLASVLERTKEIGVRRAVGASRNDVLGQFLFEATFLSVVGGVIGIVLGFGLTQIITLYAGWRTVVSVGAIVLSFTVSAAVGIGFGYYPARKAAYQNPIDSLRYE
jgi:putative ABC transport system permease protein